MALAERWQWHPDDCDRLPLGYSRRLPDILWALDRARAIEQRHASAAAATGEAQHPRRGGRRMTGGSMTPGPGG